MTINHNSLSEFVDILKEFDVIVTKTDYQESELPTFGNSVRYHVTNFNPIIDIELESSFDSLTDIVYCMQGLKEFTKIKDSKNKAVIDQYNKLLTLIELTKE